MKKLILSFLFIVVFVSGTFAREIIPVFTSHWRSCEILPDNTIRAVYVEYTTDRTSPLLFRPTYRKELLNAVDHYYGFRHIFTYSPFYVAKPKR